MNTLQPLRTAVITGTTSGIGLELTRLLLEDNWHVITLNRSALPEQEADIQAALSSGRLRSIRANLTNYASLSQGIKQIYAETDVVDVLFNNAGGSMARLEFSDQGHELHFELQTVIPYIMFKELSELLRRSQIRTVIHTSSTAFQMLKRFDLHLLEHPAKFKKLFGPYAASKLALSLWTREVASTAQTEDIRLLSIDPGGNNTLRGNKTSGLPFYIKPLMKWFFSHPSRGASLLYQGLTNIQATSPESGSFLVKNKPVALPFTEQGSSVLHRVNEIYEEHFLTRIMK